MKCLFRRSTKRGLPEVDPVAISTLAKRAGIDRDQLGRALGDPEHWNTYLSTPETRRFAIGLKRLREGSASDRALFVRHWPQIDAAITHGIEHNTRNPHA